MILFFLDFSFLSGRRLAAYPKGHHGDFLCLFLEAADLDSLPCGWKIYAEFRFAIVNQFSEKQSVRKGISYICTIYMVLTVYVR